MTDTTGVSSTDPPDDHLPAITLILLSWTAQHLPDVPWNLRAGDPCTVWVAAVMLQQTRVSTVIAYYSRFLDLFPSLQELASSCQSSGGAQGMGRAGLLCPCPPSADGSPGASGALRGSEFCRSRRSPPPTWGWRVHSAVAILGIAFGADEPIYDGNVRRILLCRLFAIDGDARRPALKRRLQALPRCLLPPGQAGSFHQGLMHFGARVCTPRSPFCTRCPVSYTHLTLPTTPYV